MTSYLNSSITPLNDTDTFTGTAETCKDYNSISLLLKADRSATVQIQHGDGTNWDHIDEFESLADVGLFKQVQTKGTHYRVTVQNTSGNDMTYMRLKCKLLHSNTPDELNVHLDSNDMVKAILSDGSGSALDLSGGILKVKISNPEDIAGGSSSNLSNATDDVLIYGKDSDDINRALYLDGNGRLVQDHTSNSALMWGFDGSSDQALSVDSSGRLKLDQSSSTVTVYGYDGENDVNRPLAVDLDGALWVHKNMLNSNDDSIKIYGADGGTERAVKVNSSGELVIQKNNINPTDDMIAVFGSDGSESVQLSVDNTGKMKVVKNNLSQADDSVQLYGSDGTDNYAVYCGTDGKLGVTVDNYSEFQPILPTLSVYISDSLATTPAEVKGSSGRLHKVTCENMSGAVRYLRLYNKGSTPSNSDTPLLNMAVRENSSKELTFNTSLNFDLKLYVVASSAFGLTTSYGAVSSGDVLVTCVYE